MAARLGGFAANMQPEAAGIVGRPATHPWLYVRAERNWRFKMNYGFRLRLRLGHWRAPLQIKAMRLADHGVPRYPTKLLCNLPRRQAFSP
jgi:hypothetical protein